MKGVCRNLVTSSLWWVKTLCRKGWEGLKFWLGGQEDSVSNAKLGCSSVAEEEGQAPAPAW